MNGEHILMIIASGSSCWWSSSPAECVEDRVLEHGVQFFYIMPPLPPYQSLYESDCLKVLTGVEIGHFLISCQLVCLSFMKVMTTTAWLSSEAGPCKVFIYDFLYICLSTMYCATPTYFLFLNFKTFLTYYIIQNLWQWKDLQRYFLSTPFPHPRAVCLWPRASFSGFFPT